jgi:hypothetical protein
LAVAALRCGSLRSPSLRCATAKPPGERTTPREFPFISSFFFLKLKQYEDLPIPLDWTKRDVVLYCACPNEGTSARVALALHRKGINHVRPLEGGLKAWGHLGFPVVSTIPAVSISALRKLDHVPLCMKPQPGDISIVV